MMLTLDEIRTLAHGLRAHELAEFAARVRRADAVLGVVVTLHAKAADGHSPELLVWIAETAREAAEIHRAGITTRADAARWISHYADTEMSESEKADIVAQAARI